MDATISAKVGIAFDAAILAAQKESASLIRSKKRYVTDSKKLTLIDSASNSVKMVMKSQLGDVIVSMKINMKDLNVSPIEIEAGNQQGGIVIYLNFSFPQKAVSRRSIDIESCKPPARHSQ
jgi:hypothetical protein